MSYRIDDDENRLQDIKDQIDQLEVQTFSPEVVARNESTRNTGIETGDSAALNPYPMWIPIRDFGDVGLVTLEIVLNRVDSHVAKMKIIGDVDFAFSLPPPTNKMMWFILDTTIDNVGGYTINLLNNIIPAGITINNTANARTVIRFTTTDGGVTYYAEDLSTIGGGAGDNLGNHIATQALQMQNNTIFLDTAQDQSIFALSLANNYVVPVGGAHDFFVNDTVIPKFGITETAIQSNVVLNMNSHDILNVDRLQLSGGTASATSVNDVVWYLDSNGNLVSNVNAIDGWIWSSGNIPKMILTDDTLEKRNVTAPTFQLYNTRTAQVGTAGTIAILANSVNITTGATMGFMIVDTELETGNGTGSMKLGVNVNGLLTSFIEINDSNDGNIKFKADVDVNINDIINVDRLQLSGGTASATSVNDVVWYLDSNGNLVSNVNATDGWIWSSGNIPKMILTDDTLEKRNVTAPVFQLYNTRTAQVGNAGIMQILANTANTSTGVPMGFIISDTEVQLGDGSGSLKFGVNLNGIATNFITLNDNNDGNVKLLTDLDLGANFMQLSEIALPTNPAANNGLIYLRDVAGTTTPFFLDSVGTETSLIAGGGTGNQISQGDSLVRVTDVGTGVINFEVDSTPLGSITTGLGWVLENDLILASGDLNMSSNNIINANSMDTDGLGVNNTLTSLGQTNLNGNTLLGDFSTDNITGFAGVARDWIPDTANVRIMGDTALNWSSLAVGRTNYITGGVLSGRILVDGSGVEIEAILPGDFIELKTQASVRANFKAEADGGITFFEPLEVNDNIRIDGGNMIHANDGVECGFAVTDDITSPGSFGTMQMPVNTGNAVNAAGADTDFGAAVGCYGIYLNGQGVGTPIYVIKIDDSPTTWATLLLNASGNVSAGRLT